MKFCIALLLTAVLYATAAKADAPESVQDNYDLVYNKDDGSLTIVATGIISGYTLVSNQSPGPFLEDESSNSRTNHIAIFALEEVVPGIIFPTGLISSTPTILYDIISVDKLLNGDYFPAGTYNIGNLLPVGLTEAEFVGVFDEQAVYYTTAISQQDEIDFDLIYVPEPNSLAMLLAAGLMFGQRRRLS